jgi:hypothetical protein
MLSQTKEKVETSLTWLPMIQHTTTTTGVWQAKLTMLDLRVIIWH